MSPMESRTARLLDGCFPPGGEDEPPDRLFVM
jgi:hypothetical protein